MPHYLSYGADFQGSSSLSALLRPHCRGSGLPYGCLRRMGRDPPRWPNADWRVLTTANAAGTNITLSKVIPLINCLIRQIDDMVEHTSFLFIRAMGLRQVQLQKRFCEIEFIPIVAISISLDPRFKNLHFRNAEACAITWTQWR
ncbi:unnamed protein product [Diatraea saccharalis]|uniref:Uncharacterized protein n=1 Tax=Diatraea saccharalis TaxID=40085 RepID=A0A9N9WIN9_9NEOP|nr:unnamed protein product [Diatraea saccharalis]